MESYLILFEQAIDKQAELMGEKIAHQQARQAGLIVSDEGHIVSCSGNPIVVLLRLIKSFTQNCNLAALDACAPLISKLTKATAEMEETDS
jgi:hypothetical protein